jgi:hypothetical protein
MYVQGLIDDEYPLSDFLFSPLRRNVSSIRDEDRMILSDTVSQLLVETVLLSLRLVHSDNAADTR